MTVEEMVDRAHRAYHVGLAHQGLRWLHRAADRGHTEAQLALGRAYLYGHVRDTSGTLVGTVPQDTAASGHWYRQATTGLQARAGRGDAEALMMLGELYFTGLGVPRDLDRAAAYLEQATAKGHALAHFRLGGVRGEQGAAGAACTHYRAAADLGLREGYSMLSAMHLTGGCAPRSPMRAVAVLHEGAVALSDSVLAQEAERHVQMLLQAVADGDAEAPRVLRALEEQGIPVRFSGTAGDRPQTAE